jgi:hypothetical protein
MISAHSSSWLFALGLLVPVALAARGRKRPERKKQPSRPREEVSFRGLLVVVTMIALGVGIGLGIRWHLQRPGSPSAGSSATSRGASSTSEALPGTLSSTLAETFASQLMTTLNQTCPRLASRMWGDAGVPSRTLTEVLRMECLDRLCEQPASPDAGPSSSRRLSEQMCQRLLAGMSERMIITTDDYRLACPEIAVPWGSRPWSPSTELGFYAALRPCLERICEQLVSGEGIPAKYCMHAADIAEGFGDMQAAARLRERARAVQALSEAMWQGLTPEQRERAKTDQDMKILARRWGEVCRQGMTRYCEFLDEYCAVEGHPPDVCPEKKPLPARRDAGPQ